MDCATSAPICATPLHLRHAPCAAHSRGLEDEDCVPLPDGVRRHLPLPGLQPAVGQVVEAHPGTVVLRRLPGVAHPPLDMVEAQEATPVRPRALEGQDRINVFIGRVRPQTLEAQDRTNVLVGSGLGPWG